MLETIFLDAGGVLVHPNWERVSETLSRHGVPVSADVLRGAEPYAKFVIDEGSHIATTTDAQRGWQYMNLVLEKAGIPLTEPVFAAFEEIHAYHAEHNLWEHVPADVVPSLERLRGLGLRMVVLSNANGVLERMFDRVGLSRHFDIICDSCVFGVEKPDPRYFEMALARAGARAETTMHVGDLYHVDIVGARRAGVRPLLLDTANLYEGFDCERVRTVPAVVDVASRLRAES
jgi:HAD superfamily hydrolase (TIGR01549 family)